MKNYGILVLALLMSLGMSAQLKQKIKGDKQLETSSGSLEPFTAVEISDNLEVTLIQGEGNSYRLTADSNLMDVVKMDVFDGTLKVYTTRNITSYKNLELKLTFSELKSLTIADGVELESQGRLVFTDFSLNASGQAEYKMDMLVSNGNFQLSNGSEGNLKLKANSATVIMNDNANLKGNLVMERLDLEVNKRADVNVEGEVDELLITTTGSTDIKAKKLKAETAQINASNTSDIYVNASKELTLYAQGKSYIYVYGNPEIKIEGLNDKSRIIKKS